MFTDVINRLKQIDLLIKQRNTGKPADLAHRLNICERSLYDHLQLMRKLGAPIEFSLYLQTYYYQKGGDFILGFVDNPDDNLNGSLISELNVAKSAKTKKKEIRKNQFSKKRKRQNQAFNI